MSNKWLMSIVWVISVAVLATLVYAVGDVLRWLGQHAGVGARRVH